MFSKAKAGNLAPHCPYDLKIDLEENAQLPIGRMYPLLEHELEALQMFLDENLQTNFVCPSCSTHRAPILFIKKKDSSLCLCVDYRGLNKNLKKNWYPLLLITDLLDAPRKARIYTKSDLCHAYHLIRIWDSDKWKTMFQTKYRSFKWMVILEGLTNAPAVFQ